MSIDYGTVHSIATVAAMAAFGGICWWAWRPANRQRFEEDSLLPFVNEPLLNNQAAGQKADRATAGENAK